ncbi:MAG: ABC transporter substrate-binding protein [Actinomycetota bacterium]
MRNRWTALLALAAVFAACGGGDDAADTTVSSVAPSTAASSSTEPVPTSDAATTVGSTIPSTEPSTGPSSAPPTGSSTGSSGGDGPITVVDDRGVEVVIDSVERIVPVDGDLAEIVWALGFGDNVVATDISATYPEAADSSTKIGYQRALSPEPILDVEPTVVLATEIAGPPETLTALERTGVPVVVVPTPPTADGPATKIRAVADALGVSERGEELAAAVDSEIAAATARVDESIEPPRVAAMYVRGENVQLVLGAESGIGWVLDEVGAVNIADELGVADAEAITAEAMLVAAPDVIIVPAAGLESVGGVEGLLSIQGLGETPAGQTGRVFAYDDQYLLGNGPRTGQLIEQMITDIYAGAQ